jgi:LysM repeat protein
VRRRKSTAGALLPDIRFVPVDVALTTIERLARHRPRYLVHGLVAFVGLTTVTAYAVQPRSAPIATAVAVAPAVAEAEDAAPPLLALQPEQDVLPTEDEPAPAPDVAAEPGPAAEPTARPAPAKPSVHTVEQGETVRGIAAQYGVSPETVMVANDLNDPDMLQVGQDLVILPTDGVLYTLHDGESIRRVADYFGVATADIVEANDLGEDPDVVQPGTELVIPGAAPKKAPTGSIAEQESTDQQAASIGGGQRIPVETARAVPSTRTYEVQPGDTLARVADTFGVDVDTILSSNGIDDPDTIKPGSELRILPVKGIEYTVEADETLADIAYKYQVDLGLLLDYNNLNDPDVIRVGLKLVVPGGRLRADPAPAPAEPVVEAPAPAPRTAGAASAAVVPAPAPKPAPKPAAPAPKPAPAPEPELSSGDGGASIVANAMKYLGYRYVFGGTSPAGFD